MTRRLLTAFVALIGLAVASIAGPAAANRSRPPAVFHTPPLFAKRSEQIILKFDAVCDCYPPGNVFVRATGAASFDEFPLDHGVFLGTVGIRVPVKYTRGEGFDYYARIGGRLVPAGGAAAPHHVWVVRHWTTIRLGVHRFGHASGTGRVVFRAPWGRGPRALGHDRYDVLFGPSAFDVAGDGSLTVLDRVNRRLVTAGPWGRRLTEIRFDSAVSGDMTLGPDGTAYVLEPMPTSWHRGRGTVDRRPGIVRAYRGGHLVWTQRLAEMSLTLRMGAEGPVFFGADSEMWLPVARAGQPLGVEQQRQGATDGLTLPGGAEVVTWRRDHVIRVAIVKGSSIVGAWRVVTETNFGRVQLAAPLEDGLRIVTDVWSGKLNAREFQELRLTSGALSGGSVGRALRAETDYPDNVRLAGRNLYQLETFRAGVVIRVFRL